MAGHYTCPSGHRWGIAASPADGNGVCPLCGKPASGADADSVSAAGSDTGPIATEPHVLPSTDQLSLRTPDADSSVAETPYSALSPAPPELPVVPGYAIQGVLGEGGMAQVFRGLDPKFNRVLAVKVLKEKHRGNAELTARFLEEAQITGQLQNPGIPPVHDVGKLPDGRPYFTIKRVQGRTLHELLAARKDPAPDLPRFLALFGQVCQTLAYAHAHGVIHRDLKPGNVMVGKFDDVQVMDWGFAKVLGRHGIPDADTESLALLQTVRSVGLNESSIAGSIFGTPAFMAPEQARGETDRLDERCDVFGLGGILCVILTGKPPFTPGKGDVLRQAQKGQVADAVSRLDACKADTELIDLARRCLAADKEDRPRDAGVVSQAMAAYQAGVQERLRRAEVDRAAAQVKALEERKRRKLAVALAALVLALALLGGAGAWALVQWRGKTDDRIQLALQEASNLRSQAQVAPAGERALVHWGEAEAAARRLDDLITQGFPSPQLRLRVRDFNAAVADEAAAAHRQAEEANRDQLFLNELAEVRTSKADYADKTDNDAGYRQAFLHYGLDVDDLTTEAAAARLLSRTDDFRVEVAAALDDWALERYRLKRPEADWQRLVALARAVDLDPWRTALRSLDLNGISNQREKLVELADTAKVSELAPASVQLLGRALRAAGEGDRAETVLRVAQQLHPGDIWLNYQLAETLKDRPTLNADEVIRFYTAAQALRPEIGHALGHALEHSGKNDEALKVFAELTRLRPANAQHHNCLGRALFNKEQFDDAIAEYNKAIALNPQNAGYHTNLGLALKAKNQLDDAIAEHKKAIDLDPKNAHSHYNLGAALAAKNQLDDAIAEFKLAIALDPIDTKALKNLARVLYRNNQVDDAIVQIKKAIALDPEDADAHQDLGTALQAKDQLDDAIAEFKLAIALDPKDAMAHNNLGIVLKAKNQLDDAIAEHKQAIALDPKYATAHYSLGNALKAKNQLDDAIAEYKQAIALDPKYAKAHNDLGIVLADKNRLDDAIAEYNQAIALDPKFAMPHYNLGNALKAKNRQDDAIAAYKQAIALDPKFAQAHCNLGLVLERQGQFAAALEELRKGHELGSARPGWRNPSAQWVQDAERWVALDAKLAAIVEGKEKPANDAERLALARFCQQPFKKLYGASCRFFAEAFANDAKLADDMQKQHRYNAACAAALAGCGLGNDTDKLDDKERAILRQQAVDWLRADLAHWTMQADSDTPKDHEVVQAKLKHWQEDTDFAGVRAAALEKLPAAERDAWRKLWQDVDALLAKTREKK